MSEVVGEAVIRIRTDDSGLDGAVDDAGKKAGKGYGGGFVGSLKGILTGGAMVAVGAAAGKALFSALDFDQANSQVQAQLGLTEKQAGRSGRVAGQLYADNYGDSLSGVQDAVGAVQGTIKGLRGASETELAAASQAALDFADVFGVDVQDAASQASRLISSGLASDATSAFDLLTTASQKAGPGLTEPLLEATNEYAQFFSQIGLDGGSAFGALVSAADRGEFGIDKAGDAIKEFTIRATDGSAASRAAYDELGLSADDMSNKLLAGGDQAGKATQRIVDGLLGIKDPTKQANTAIALFGTPLEDLGTKNIPKFLDSLSGAKGALGDVSGATKDAGDTLRDTPLAQIQGAFRELQGDVLGVATDALPLIIDGFNFLSGVFSDAMTAIDPLIQGIGDLFSGIDTSVLQGAAKTLLAVLFPLVGVFVAFQPQIAAVVSYLADTLGPVFGDIATIVQTQVVPLFQQFAGFVTTTVLPALGVLVTAIATRLKPVFDQLVATFRDTVLPTVSRLIAQFRDEFIPAIQPVITKIAGVVGFLLKLAATILGAVLPPLIRFAGFLISNIVPVLVTIITTVVKVVGAVLSFGGALIGAAQNAVGFGAAILGSVRDAFNSVVDAVTGLPGRIGALAGRLRDVGKRIIGAFVDGLKNAGGVVSDIAGNIWSTLKGLINSAIDKLNSALEFKISLPGPDITINPPNIPGLAKGTDNWRGGTVWVGEEGPELLDLPRGSRVTPNAESMASMRPGAGAGVYINQLVAHDYQDFTRQATERERLATLGGRR